MAGFVCPNCRGSDIETIKVGRYTGLGCFLLLLGIPLLLLNGLGIVFIAAGLFLGCITQSAYRCRRCKSEA
ncbi:MAG: hypothetical protein NTZ92_05145 [Candidatus Omnitrophica bacterium]|nr:hypothetical protein [Candidatus Omnitrophota bacterium]